jgi:hypothetical protein
MFFGFLFSFFNRKMTCVGLGCYYIGIIKQWGVFGEGEGGVGVSGESEWKSSI